MSCASRCEPRKNGPIYLCIDLYAAANGNGATGAGDAGLSVKGLNVDFKSGLGSYSAKKMSRCDNLKADRYDGQ